MLVHVLFIFIKSLVHTHTHTNTADHDKWVIALGGCVASGFLVRETGVFSHSLCGKSVCVSVRVLFSHYEQTNQMCVCKDAVVGVNHDRLTVF